MARRDRPCLLYQIKRCSAPCVGRVDKQGYEKLVDQAKAFLTGKSGQVRHELEQQMQYAAESLDFESAAILRDRLRAATFIQGSQAINEAGVRSEERRVGIEGLRTSRYRWSLVHKHKKKKRS